MSDRRMSTLELNLAQRARYIRDRIPPAGLFAGQEWRISPLPFNIDPQAAKELQSLGRVLLQFYRASNLLYRQSLAGKEPSWVAEWLDQGKPAELVAWQRAASFKNQVPRVIRPDILLTDSGMSIIELDSVPGGIGLTAWLNQTYSTFPKGPGDVFHQPSGIVDVLGGSDAMLDGFAGMFGEASKVHIVISEEAGTYRPEMEWLAGKLGPRFEVNDTRFTSFKPGEAVYRFFELFDLANIPNAELIFSMADKNEISLTPPPKPIFEEKMLFALLWNRNLQEFWRRQLGQSFFQRMLKLVPYSWVVDPGPIPPHAAIPELNLTDWNQLKALSQKGRDLILKISGYSDKAWGARGVYLGSDLPQAEWSAALDEAINAFPHSPYVLQRYERPKLVDSSYFDFQNDRLVPMPGRARLCPYYFVLGDGDSARAHLGGVLATICPSDKKIIHGMKEAILAPCSTAVRAEIQS